MIEKQIVFSTISNGKQVVPKWVPVSGVNATCPRCQQLMMVFSGETEYAFCPRCKQYYLDERSFENEKHKD